LKSATLIFCVSLPATFQYTLTGALYMYIHWKTVCAGFVNHSAYMLEVKT